MTNGTDPAFPYPEIDEKWSPAEVNQILFRNFEDPNQAMDELLDLQVSNPLLKDSTPAQIDHTQILGIAEANPIL